MEKFKTIVRKQIDIAVSTEEEAIAIASSIHRQLEDNQDYLDSNIVLKIGDDNVVRVFILNDCEEDPTIVI